MKKIKKSTGLTIALLIYVSLTAAYFLPRNSVIGTAEKWLTVGGSYLIVFALWLALRYKERRNQQKNSKTKKLNK